MKKFVLATASAAALMVAGSAMAAGPVPLMPTPVPPTADKNSAIEQVGDNNSADVNQYYGTRATSLVVQGVGALNAHHSYASVKQGGADEQSVVLQGKDYNKAYVDQAGSKEQAFVLQYGDGNTASITQSGQGTGTSSLYALGIRNGAAAQAVASPVVQNIGFIASQPSLVYNVIRGHDGAGVIQVGGNNGAGVEQRGARDTALTIQNGDWNNATSRQFGGTSDSLILSVQSGDHNTANADQYAANDTAITWQNGDYNQSYTTQYNAAAFSTVAQSGNGNLANTVQ
jgi:hypothetical protein